MDTKEYIRKQFAMAWRTSDGALGGLTDELLNWTPPGTANPISAVLAHIIGGEDLFVQTVILGKPTIWESQGWSEKVGVTATPGKGTAWEEYRGKKLSVDALMAYKEAVRAETREFLETLSDEDLSRKVNFAELPGWTGADMLVLLTIHILEHSGEVAVLKGIQGVQGLPI